MRLSKIITGLLIAGATAAALAQPVSVTGKVQTVFVREARGLYYEKKLLTGTANKPLWAEVRPATSIAVEVQTELVRVPAILAIERGDVVAIKIEDDTPLTMNLIPAVSRVTALVAKHDTLAAAKYEFANPPPAQSMFVQAEACSQLVPTQLATVNSIYR